MGRPSRYSSFNETLYSASKLFLYFQLFNQEETKHIRVAQISPGLVETEFSFVMNKGNEDKAESLYKSIQCLQAQDMADHVKYILETPKHVQITDILVRPTEQKS